MPQVNKSAGRVLELSTVNCLIQEYGIATCDLRLLLSLRKVSSYFLHIRGVDFIFNYSWVFYIFSPVMHRMFLHFILYLVTVSVEPLISLLFVSQPMSRIFFLVLRNL